MSEIVTADRWLKSVLGSDATLAALTPKVYKLPAPQGAQLPYAAFNMLSAVDLQAVGTARVWSDMLYVVRAIFETNTLGGNLELAANRIDVLLQAASGSASSGVVWACVREQPFEMEENNAGQELRHLGGIYRIFATG